METDVDLDNTALSFGCRRFASRLTRRTRAAPTVVAVRARALAELAYALDDLRLDGVVLFSNARGSYLGDPRFVAVGVAQLEPLVDQLLGLVPPAGVEGVLAEEEATGCLLRPRIRPGLDG